MNQLLVSGPVPMCLGFACEACSLGNVSRAESPSPAGRWKEEERTHAHTSRFFSMGERRSRCGARYARGHPRALLTSPTRQVRVVATSNPALITETPSEIGGVV
ncbi:hypothetical protein Taro_037236 [Colocasia esculenta]|uniref:Uncharacterized protein n=1 Tax=Colocasia esculenta TaxID=4460 RepID=A0A843WFP1_COLES|nr:hypothetical protein [Colocasia esculenta]